MKKLTLSVLAIVFASTFSFGQLRELDNGGVPDEDKIPGSRMDQHEAFLDGEYRFPAKPRNMWTFGIEGGYDQVNGDVRPDFGWGIGGNFRKALGYATSIRFGANYMMPTGIDKSTSRSYLVAGNLKQKRSGIPVPAGKAYNYIHEFNSEVILPYAEFVLNLNNINFHREQTKWGFELSAGPAAYMYDTKTTFRDVETNTGASVGTFEDRHLGNSDATREDGLVGDFIVIPAVTSSAAIAYRASSRLAVSLRPRFTFTWDDWLDGEAYDDTGINPSANSDYSPNKDQNFALNLGLDFALGKKGKRVQPLWWENPLNFTYPYLQDAYEFDDEYLFEDSDGDGVVDRLDKEPDSPCSFVDGGGVAIDSDKDGIVDCNDACPFTPAAVRSEIDENGCTPEPVVECCEVTTPPVVVQPVSTCETKRYASITFPENSKAIPATQNSTIAGIASTLSEDPSCRIVIEGFASGRRKVAQQIAWARAKAVADALVDNFGISRDRIIVRYSGVEGYGDVVMVRPARYDESGSSNPAAPSPGIQ